MPFCPTKTQRLLPLCSIKSAMSKDGFAGASASILLPFYPRRYFFSGAIPATTGGTIAQDQSRSIHGSHLPAIVGKGFTTDCGPGVIL